MSKKKRDQIDDLTQNQQSDDKPKIHFSFWFQKALNDRKVKFYQEDALLVFFKKQGLGEEADEDSYNRALEKF